jgi:hypothetical protein
MGVALGMFFCSPQANEGDDLETEFSARGLRRGIDSWMSDVMVRVAERMLVMVMSITGGWHAMVVRSAWRVLMVLVWVHHSAVRPRLEGFHSYR